MIVHVALVIASEPMMNTDAKETEARNPPIHVRTLWLAEWFAPAKGEWIEFVEWFQSANPLRG